jgi:hypothetical protein
VQLSGWQLSRVPCPVTLSGLRAVRGPRSPARGPPLARPRVYHYFCRYFFSREKFTAELNFLRRFGGVTIFSPVDPGPRFMYKGPRDPTPTHWKKCFT